MGFNTSAYDNTKPECDCGYGVPGQNNFNACYGNAFYLGIYGAIGVSVGIMSFTKGSVVFVLVHGLCEGIYMARNVNIAFT